MPTLTGKSVAFIGLGIMGSAMAANLARQGATVVGWNRTAGKQPAETARQAGVRVVQTLPEALADASFIFSCVGDETDAEQILCNEVSRHAKAGALIVDTTTIGPAVAKKIASHLGKHNLRFLDAPVTGGDVGAREGTLTILVGGHAADFAECKPLLEAMGKRIFLCGPHGAGQAMKLCNQILCAVNMVAVSESFALAKEMDIDLNLLIECLSQGAGGSWALSTLGPRVAKGDFLPGFTLEHMLKDLRLVKENLQDGHELPGSDLATRLFDEARRMGAGSGQRQGTQAMFRVYDAKAVPNRS